MLVGECVFLPTVSVLVHEEDESWPSFRDAGRDEGAEDDDGDGV